MKEKKFVIKTVVQSLSPFELLSRNEIIVCSRQNNFHTLPPKMSLEVVNMLCYIAKGDKITDGIHVANKLTLYNYV